MARLHIAAMLTQGLLWPWLLLRLALRLRPVRPALRLWLALRFRPALRLRPALQLLPALRLRLALRLRPALH